VAGYFEAASVAPSEIELTMYFAPSTGGSTTPVSTQIAQGTTHSDASYNAIADAATIAGPVNLESPTTGYVDIIIKPSVAIFTGITLTSIQILPVAGETTVPIYSEVSVPIQESLNSYYWLPKIEAKPIPSYLVGWDFPLNPYQAQGTSTLAAQALGANTSYYIADQTILFQTVTSGFTTKAATTGLGLEITASATSSFAVIQYVSPLLVKELIAQRMSVQIKCSKTGADLIGTIGLYYSIDNAAVPVLPLSLFTGITAGVPALTTGWVEVPNTYPTQSFTASTTSSATPFSFSGFDAISVSSILTAQNFAIAITFNTMTSGEVLTINYCSLVGGDIATRPAPQSSSAVLKDCQYYYQSSFPYATKPAENAGGGIYGLSGVGGSLSGFGPFYVYPVPMRTNPALTFYTTQSTGSVIWNLSRSLAWGTTSSTEASSIAFTSTATSNSTTAGGDLLSLNFTSDSRLGVN
jgi:hypothetical protein